MGTLNQTLTRLKTKSKIIIGTTGDTQSTRRRKEKENENRLIKWNIDGYRYIYIYLFLLLNVNVCVYSFTLLHFEFLVPMLLSVGWVHSIDVPFVILLQDELVKKEVKEEEKEKKQSQAIILSTSIITHQIHDTNRCIDKW